MKGQKIYNMIFKEFAIDPSSVNTKESFRYWMGLMKLEKGRQISRYPKKWKKLLYSSLNNCKDREKKYIENYLLKMPKETFKARFHEFDYSNDWLDNAFIEHKKRSFHAIITEKDHDLDEVLNSKDVDETHELLNTNPSIPIKREIEEMIPHLKPLVQQGNQIALVDRYFSPDSKDHLDFFIAFMNSIEDLITKNIKYFCSQENGGTDDYFKDGLLKKLKGKIDKGISFDVFRLEHKLLHNRFILTDSHGGVIFGHGLSVSSPNSDKNDEINYLDPKSYEKRYRQYVISNTEPNFTIQL